MAIDVIKTMIDQAKRSKHKPDSIYVIVKGKLVDILKNKKKYRKYFKGL